MSNRKRYEKDSLAKRTPIGRHALKLRAIRKTYQKRREDRSFNEWLMVGGVLLVINVALFMVGIVFFLSISAYLAAHSGH